MYLQMSQYLRYILLTALRAVDLIVFAHIFVNIDIFVLLE